MFSKLLCQKLGFHNETYIILNLCIVREIIVLAKIEIHNIFTTKSALTAVHLIQKIQIVETICFH